MLHDSVFKTMPPLLQRLILVFLHMGRRSLMLLFNRRQHVASITMHEIRLAVMQQLTGIAVQFRRIRYFLS